MVGAGGGVEEMREREMAGNGTAVAGVEAAPTAPVVPTGPAGGGGPPWTMNCPVIENASPLAYVVHPAVESLAVRLGGGTPQDASPLVWAVVVGFLSLAAFLVLFWVLWEQSTFLTWGNFAMEDLTGVSEAYLRSRAMSPALPDFLLTKRNLRPEAFKHEVPEVDGEQSEQESVKKKGEKEAVEEKDYSDLSIGARLPEDVKPTS